MTNKMFAEQRRALRVSQGRIARLVGLSQPMISQFELGNVALKSEDIDRLEKALRQEVARIAKDAAQVAANLNLVRM